MSYQRADQIGGGPSLELLEPRLLLSGTVLISEFLASNDSGLQDVYLAYSDWIELHNAGGTSVNLTGWSLTDDADELGKWVFPAVTLPAHETMVVFASGRDRTDPAGELHTNFSLSRNGEYLALVRPGGLVEHAYAPEYPAQLPDISFGLMVIPDTQLTAFFTTPTPGELNVGGTADLGPILRDAAHSPSQPGDHEDMVVTVQVTEALAPVATVTLSYRVMYGAESAVAMYDDGVHGDGLPGDGVYGATIPASAAGPGEMIRYHISATDTDANASRWPVYVPDAAMPKHLGTMVADPSLGTEVPILHWFVETPGSEEVGTRASVYYDGQFYDNVWVRLRGAVSQGWAKDSYKFDFNKGDYFRFAPEEARVEEFNLNSTFTDKSYMRQVLAYETYAAAGVPIAIAFPMHLRQNCQFNSLAAFVEQVDEDLLDREGLDPNGALYKMYSNLGVANGDKKTRTDEGFTDLADLVTGLALGPAPRQQYIYDNINIPAVINYVAATTIMGDTDHVRKNYYVYRDTEGTGEWMMLPWDKDLTFGRNDLIAEGVLNDTIWADVDPYNHPLFADSDHLAANGAYNVLIDAMHDTPAIREMYLRRLRTLMDELLGASAGEALLDGLVDDLAARIGPDVALDRAKWGNPYGEDQDLLEAVAVLNSDYLAVRRTHLFETHGPSGGGIIPDAQSPSATIDIGVVEYMPASGDPDEQYIQLVNPNGYAVDISSWRLTGAAQMEFAPGTVIPAGGVLYVTPDVVAFRARATAPTGGMSLFVQGEYSGRVRPDGRPVRLCDAEGATMASFVADGVVINELVADSSDPSGDWVELHNLTGAPVDVGGWHLSDDDADLTQYRIPDWFIIPAGGYRVLTAAGHFGAAFGLGRNGDELLLSAPSPVGDPVTVDDVRFGAAEEDVSFGRYVLSTGDVDFVILESLTGEEANADPLVGPVVINEIMYHPSEGGDEFIELHNLTGSPLPLYDPAYPTHTWTVDGAMEFTFAVGAEIPANGFVVLTDADVTVPVVEAAFRAAHDIPGDVAVLGPYAGQLSNAGESIKLYRPGPADPIDGDYARIRVDRVRFGDDLPWPTEADGDGFSLERADADEYGNDPANWNALSLGGSAGRVNAAAPAMVVTASAGPASGLVGLTVAFTGSAVGGSGVYSYSWDFRDGATSSAQNPAHTYNDWGVYEAELTVSDGRAQAIGSVTIVVGAALGDANGDGAVGLSDLLALADNYGRTGVTWARGDFTGDGEAGLSDLMALADNYGYTEAGATQVAASVATILPDAGATQPAAQAGPAWIPSGVDVQAVQVDLIWELPAGGDPVDLSAVVWAAPVAEADSEEASDRRNLFLLELPLMD